MAGMIRITCNSNSVLIVINKTNDLTIIFLL
jgi:hypothetical protein